MSRYPDNVPTFMRKWIPNYGRSPDFLKMVKLWQDKKDNEIVKLALAREHPIEPLKHEALDILQQNLETLRVGYPRFVDEVEMADYMGPKNRREHILKSQRDIILKKVPELHSARTEMPSPKSTGRSARPFDFKDGYGARRTKRRRSRSRSRSRSRKIRRRRR